MTPLIALLLLAPPFDPEPPNPYLAQARELYEQLDFEKCLVRVKQAAQWKASSPQDLRDVEVVGALCALNLGQRNDAVERLRLALRIDPNVELPEFASPKAVKLFMWVKRNLRGPVPPMPDEDLPPDALPKGERPIEVTAPSRFPVKPLPLVLSGASLVALIVGIAVGAHANDLEAGARAQTFEADYLSARGQALAAATGANVAYGVCLAALAAAVALLVFDR